MRRAHYLSAKRCRAMSPNAKRGVLRKPHESLQQKPCAYRKKEDTRGALNRAEFY
jgi:hypothetical protein